MLVEFTLGNYLSFQGKETFSLVASDLTELPENKIEVADDLSLIKTASLYGANASGKSNVLSGINFVDNFVRGSFKDTQEGDVIETLPFRLDAHSTTKPSFFEITFIDENTLVRIGFEVNQEEVIKEWLFIDEIEIYMREGLNLVRNNLTDDPSIDLKWSMTRKNVLFISVLASTNTHFAQNIISYFKHKVNVISGIQNTTSNFTKLLLKENKNDAKEVLNFLNQLDINITGVELDYKESKNRRNTDNREISDELKKIIELNSTEILTKHNIYNTEGKIIGETKFPARMLESSGTNQLIAFSGPIVDTLKHGGTLFIDEMDSQLHPLLSQAIIKLFNSKEINKNHAQLIITTHNVINLSNTLFRRDQIWFVEKDAKERSHLISLVEYKFNSKRIRSDEVYSKNYLKGKYGAIPLLPQEIKVLGIKNESIKNTED